MNRQQWEARERREEERLMVVVVKVKGEARESKA